MGNEIFNMVNSTLRDGTYITYAGNLLDFFEKYDSTGDKVRLVWTVTRFEINWLRCVTHLVVAIILKVMEEGYL